MKPAALDPAALAAMLASPRPPVLVDVRPEGAFARGHLPGAWNNCVFEVAFLERMPGVAPDLAAPVCVYGECTESEESLMAAEKLRRSGYAEVYDLRCGIGDWISAGLPVEQAGAEEDRPAAIPGGRRQIDPEESRIRWAGRNLLNMHHGTLSLKSGHLDFEAGSLAGGEFVIDMRSIRCTDLEGSPLLEVFIRHMFDHDFFDVELYPEARFVITRAAPVPGAGAGSPGLAVEGMLTLKDVTAPVAFTAAHGVTSDGKAAAQAVFSIDRTRWNVKYGSGRLFRNLGGHLVNDMIDLQIRIVTL